MVAALLFAAAVAAEPPPYKVGHGLDCAQGFEALTRAATADAGVRPTPAPDQSRFAGYFNERTHTIYTISRPTAASHPALIKQQIETRDSGPVLVTSACGFGDRAGFDELIDGVRAINAKLATPPK